MNPQHGRVPLGQHGCAVRVTAVRFTSGAWAQRRWPTVAKPRATGNADDFAADAQRKFQRFVKEQKLDEKASQAQGKLQEVLGDVSDSAKRTYTKLDSEYDITRKAERAAKQAEESWRDIDQQYSVKRKLRNVTDEVQRQLPIWSKRASEFSETTAGKVVGVLLFVVALQSGLFFSLLNWLLLLWWLSIPLSMAFGNAIRKKQMEQMQQAEEYKQQQQQQSNPFAGLWPKKPASKGGDDSSGSPSKGRWDQDGPVVDAEWSTIDDDRSK